MNQSVSQSVSSELNYPMEICEGFRFPSLNVVVAVVDIPLGNMCQCPHRIPHFYTPHRHCEVQGIMALCICL